MRILAIGDGNVPTGFGTVMHAILGQLSSRGYNIHQLALCHNGDPHGHEWEMYPAHTSASGMYGHERVAGLVRRLKPDLAFILNDPWVVATYQNVLKLESSMEYVPTVAYMPVDGENQWSAKKLNWLKHGIAYTVYGARELRKGGFAKPIDVAPHGINLNDFAPKGRTEARTALRFEPAEAEAFIVGNVNRNQPRKRLDLTIMAFAEFVNALPVADRERCRLLMHCALVDAGWELLDLCKYFGIEKHLVFTGIRDIKDYQSLSTIERLRDIYCAMDVHVSTSIGEGWGLTAMESMACGVATLLPNHSAFKEWATGGAVLYDAPAAEVEPAGLNTVHHVPSVESLAEQLEDAYTDTRVWEGVGKAGLALVSKPEYRWSNIAKIFDRVFQEVVNG